MRLLRVRYAFIALALAPSGTAFPASFSSNGTVTIESAFSGSIVLSPAAGGATHLPRCQG